MKYKIFLLLCFIIVLSCSCTTKSNIHLKDLKLKNFQNISTDNFTFTKNWWEYFNDKQLNNIIFEGFENNLDIKIALKRITQSEQLITERKSLLYPNISLQTSRSKSKQHLHDLPPFIPSVIETRLYSGEIFSSYELDFWEKYRNLSDSAKHQFLIQKYSLNIVKKSIATNIALLYFKIINNTYQIKIIKKTVDLLKYQKKIIKKRYEKGLLSIENLYEINSKIKETESFLPTTESAIKRDKYMLNFIINKQPAENIKINSKILNVKKLKIPSNLPSDVLKRRPDVKIAIEKILAQENLLKSVRADIFPSFTLTGKYGFENENLSELIRNSSSLYSWISKIFVTVFDYGAKKAKAKKEKEKLEEFKLEYYKKVMEVLKNVESSLINFYKLKERHDNLLSELKNNINIYSIRKKNYEKGLCPILDVINGKIDILNLKSKILNSNFAIIEQYIKTLKELGY